MLKCRKELVAGDEYVVSCATKGSQEYISLSCTCEICRVAVEDSDDLKVCPFCKGEIEDGSDDDME